MNSLIFPSFQGGARGGGVSRIDMLEILLIFCPKRREKVISKSKGLHAPLNHPLPLLRRRGDYLSNLKRVLQIYYSGADLQTISPKKPLPLPLQHSYTPMNSPLHIIDVLDDRLILEEAGKQFTLPIAQLDAFLQKRGKTSLQKADNINNIDTIGRIQNFIQNFYAKGEQKIPKFLTPPPRVLHFVGREQELQDIRALLLDKKCAVVVNGLGGLGKTALALKYIEQFGEEYAHIVWIRQERNLQATFAFADTLHKSLYLAFSEADKEARRFAEVINALTNLSGQRLLVLDNYEDAPEDRQTNALQAVSLVGWHILFTSREEVRDFEAYPLDILPTEDAKRLFREHAQGKNIDNAELTALIRLVKGHTLTVELLAKTYKASWDLKSVGKMQEILERQQIDDHLLQEFVRLEGVGERVQTYKHLLQVFSLAKLNEAEKFVLTQFAVLPTMRILGKDFLAYVDDEDKEYKETLKDLARKGWLACDAEHRFEMHPLLQMILLKTLKPTLGFCWDLCFYFSELMSSQKIGANPLAYSWLIEVGEALLQRIDYEGDKKSEGVMWNTLYNLCYELGDYPRALECAKEDLRLAKESAGEEHPNYLISLNNLGLLYYKLDNYAEALPLYQEALQKWKRVLGEEHPSYITALNNLAILYSAMGNYAEALPLFQEALQKRKKVLGEYHPDYLTSLNNLAALYDAMGNYVEVLPLLQETLQKSKEVLGELHPDYALSLYNLGTFYARQDKHQEALPYLQEAYDIRKEKLGEKHPATKNAKNNLDICSAEVGEQ